MRQLIPKSAISLIIILTLSSCIFRVKKVSKYYKSNRELTLDIYKNYIKVIDKVPGKYLTLRGSVKVDNDIGVSYQVVDEHTDFADYDINGNYLDGSLKNMQLLPEVFRSEEFKKLIADFAKSKYLSVTYFSIDEKNEVFMAYGNARYNNREYIGVLISEFKQYEAVKKLENKVYIYEVDVP